MADGGGVFADLHRVFYYLMKEAVMNIYVGNLSYDVTEDELRREFEPFGEVASVNIPSDRDTGRSRGFGFVEMPTVSEGQAAIAGLNGRTLKDRTLQVNPARPRSEDRGRYGRQR
jgi:RNA recognition motif-containing protein